MSEILRNACEGWLDFMSAGKLSAIFMAVLLACWLLKLGDRRKNTFFLYGIFTAFICILPVSSAILMLYQTKFYDYEWIWSTVPLTAVSACGLALFLEWYWGKEDRKSRRGIMVMVIMVIALLCSGLGGTEFRVTDFSAQRDAVEKALNAVLESKGEEETICLWAPEEVVLHARSISGKVCLIYGRDMFQKHLNAYSYDVYSEELRELYVWMVMAGRYGTVIVPVEGDVAALAEGFETGDRIDGLACLKKAMELGVNRILLPGSMKQEALLEIEETFSLKVWRAGEYYLLVVQAP